MKVILLVKVAGLGTVDDVVDVAEGYAVNFLFPQHLAVLASNKALDNLGRERARKAKEAEQDLKEQQSLASRLDGLSITISEKTNEAGFFYAAVGVQKISEALLGMGYQVGKNQIQVKPVKEPGDYEVKIKLPHGLEATIHLVASALESKKS